MDNNLPKINVKNQKLINNGKLIVTGINYCLVFLPTYQSGYQVTNIKYYILHSKGFGDGSSDLRLQTSLENDAIDQKYGFNRHKGSTERVGWLLNMHSVIRI